MKRNLNEQEAKRFLLAYIALSSEQKKALLVNMIGILAGKTNINSEEAKIIYSYIEEAKDAIH